MGGIDLYHYHLRYAFTQENETRERALIRGSKDLYFVHDDTLLLEDLEDVVRAELAQDLIEPIRRFSASVRLIALPAEHEGLAARVRESESRSADEVILLSGQPETLQAEVAALRAERRWTLLEEGWHGTPIFEPRYWYRDAFKAEDKPGYFLVTMGEQSRSLPPAYYEQLPLSWSGRYFADLGPVLRAEEHVAPDFKEAYRAHFIDNHEPKISLYNFYW